jgi:TonB family protein
MNDEVNRVILERQALDRGLPAGFALSAAGHALLVAGAVLATLLAPRPPVLRVAMGELVVLPRGGGGTPNPEPPAPPAASAAPAPEPVAPAPEPPRVLKPPREEPRQGIPPVDAKRTRATPTPRAAARPPAAEPSPARSPAAGPGGPGRGSDTGGDFYLAGVQRKIWMIWMQQIKTGFTQPVAVSFTILADGSVADVRVIQSSGAALLDMAAQRAVLTAAPFGPLPRHYGTNRYTIQALFKPTP